MIRRITAAALCVGVLGATAVSAEAAVKAGNFRGTTDQNARISLKVLSSKKAIIKFTWEGAVMGCSDGNNRQIEGGTTGSRQRIKLSRSGRFEFNAQLGDAAEFAAVGRVNGNRATGALQVQARVNDQGALDPNGSIVCDSELVEWVARRR